MKTLTPREYHARRDAEQLAAREARRERVLGAAREAIRRHAPEHPGVRRVYLFGSVLRPGRFHARSDVDVAVDCDLEAETPFARALENELRVAVDLRPLTGRVAEAVDEEGEKVYG